MPRTRPLVRLSLLFALASATDGHAKIDAGDTTNDERDATRDERRGVIERLMERLRFSNSDTKRVATVAAGLFPPPMSEEPAALRRWLHRVGPEHFADIARAWLAGARAQEKSSTDVIRRVKALRAVLRERPPLTIADLALDGSDLKDLGLPPGPRFGEVLRFLLEEVIDRPEANNRADLEALAVQGGLLSDTLPDPES